uniref:Uncharacterized protein n=1 Tax=Asparagus officinalis TaxID=4686 RepID=Q2AA93_ASPOF|nr:hypothetical protein 17.t00010 [Asparagus officinalis]
MEVGGVVVEALQFMLKIQVKLHPQVYQDRASLKITSLGPTVKADSTALVDLILMLLDNRVTRPTNRADASMTRTYRIFGKFSAINGFDEPLPTTI